MPELPEVLTIKKDLKKEILGKKVVSVKKEKNYKPAHSTDLFSKYVVGHLVEDVDNIAKLLLIKLSSGKYIASHLNMSGILLYNTTDPYIKMSLEFDTGDMLYYSSVRMFGYFEVWDNIKLNEYKKRYGKTALDQDLSIEEFTKIIGSKNKPIKTVLLDQKLVSGIGNIYANDALFMSGINPYKKANLLGKEKLEELFYNIREILNEGIKNRGSSIDRYRDLYGKMGNQQNFFRIYGKREKNCNSCGNKIKFEKMQGRGTFYCDQCQPLDDRIRLL